MNTFITETTTLQEAVDYAVQMIVAQGGQCTNDLGDCAYGTADGGQHCGVGWLLDPANTELMECIGSAFILTLSFKDIVPALVKDNPNVMAGLQDFHDADYAGTRQDALDSLEKDGIDVSGVWFKQWVGMAVQEGVL